MVRMDKLMILFFIGEPHLKFQEFLLTFGQRPRVVLQLAHRLKQEMEGKLFQALKCKNIYTLNCQM